MILMPMPNGVYVGGFVYFLHSLLGKKWKGSKPPTSLCGMLMHDLLVGRDIALIQSGKKRKLA